MDEKAVAMTIASVFSEIEASLIEGCGQPSPQPFRISDIGRSSLTENINEIAPEEREAASDDGEITFEQILYLCGNQCCGITQTLIG